MKKLLILIIVVAIALLGYYLIFYESSPDEEIMQKMSTQPVHVVTPQHARELMSYDFPLVGTLKDVAGGNASGIAKSGVIGGQYHVLATFENLPELDEGYFWEGWAVRKFPFDFISTGKLIEVDGEMVNLYISSDADLIDHDFYVLTLEPDDGDPAPAGHVLEGTMKR
jgi:hypothetical protein